MPSTDTMMANDSCQEPGEDKTNVDKMLVHLFQSSIGMRLSFFSAQESLNLSLTSRSFNNFFSTRQAKELLSYVVKGEEDKALRLVKSNPQLLLLKTQALDYQGRTISGTAFQASLALGDKPMWEMMLPLFDQLIEGEALRRFNEQLPCLSIYTPDDFTKLENEYLFLIECINENNLIQVHQFREKIASTKEFTQGTLFNSHHLYAAYKTLVDHYNAFLEPEGRNLFFQKIIGFLQKHMTACDAQEFCSDNPLKKRLPTHLNDNTNFFTQNKNFDLGANCAAYRYFNKKPFLTEDTIRIKNNLPIERDFFKGLYYRKTVALNELKEALTDKLELNP